MMMDPANFGMAKSFFMMGQSSGFDMTNQTESDAFMAAYNAGLLAQAPGGFPSPLPEFDNVSGFLGSGLPEARRSKKVDQSKKKKARKMAKASQKKNRKK